MAKIFISYVMVLLSFWVSPTTAKTLSDLYDNTRIRMSRIQDASPEKINNEVKAVNSWLQGPISLQLTALPSTSSQGTDEYEMGVYVPFRSPEGQRLDQQQRDLSNLSEALHEERFSLLVSGVVREALWRRLSAQALVDGLEAKQQWLTSTGEVIAQKFSVGNIDRITYLRWQQESLSHQLALKKAQLALATATTYYQQVLGTEELPNNPAEETKSILEGNSQALLQQHPDLKLLKLGQSQLNLNYRLADQRLSPWTLGVIARQLRGVAGNENLVGVSINIPLTGGNTTTASDYAVWRDANNAMTEALAQTYTRLLLQMNEATNDYALSSEAQETLTEQVAIGEQITRLLQDQADSIPKVYWLEQLIAHQDLLIEQAQMRIRRQEAIAKMNQIAGVVL